MSTPSGQKPLTICYCCTETETAVVSLVENPSTSSIRDWVPCLFIGLFGDRVAKEKDLVVICECHFRVQIAGQSDQLFVYMYVHVQMLNKPHPLTRRGSGYNRHTWALSHSPIRSHTNALAMSSSGVVLPFSKDALEALSSMRSGGFVNLVQLVSPLPSPCGRVVS